MLVYASSMRARVEQMPERGETLAVMTETGLRTVLYGGRYFEAPRWHDGRLWFVDCSARTLLSISPSGGCQEHTSFADDTPCGLGILSDGTLVVLMMFSKRLLAFAEGKLSLR